MPIDSEFEVLKVLDQYLASGTKPTPAEVDLVFRYAAGRAIEGQRGQKLGKWYHIVYWINDRKEHQQCSVDEAVAWAKSNIPEDRWPTLKKDNEVRHIVPPAGEIKRIYEKYRREAIEYYEGEDGVAGHGQIGGVVINDFLRFRIADHLAEE
jgi:hypothetical protein